MSLVLRDVKAYHCIIMYSLQNVTDLMQELVAAILNLAAMFESGNVLESEPIIVFTHLCFVAIHVYH